MATRPLAAGRGAARRPATPSRQVVGVQPVYVDFKPTSEWQQDKESDILLIYLPGFLKQHLKVSTESQNIVRARGERLDVGNKWSRFQEDFQVPERCSIGAVRAKFEGGILRVTMPWRKDHHQQRSKETNNIPSMEVPAKSTLPNPDAPIPKDPNPSNIPRKGSEDTPPKGQFTGPDPKPKESSLAVPQIGNVPALVTSPSKEAPKESIPPKVGFGSFGSDRINPSSIIPQKGSVDTPPKGQQFTGPDHPKPKESALLVPGNRTVPVLLTSPSKEALKESNPPKGGFGSSGSGHNDPSPVNVRTQPPVLLTSTAGYSNKGKEDEIKPRSERPSEPGRSEESSESTKGKSTKSQKITGSEKNKGGIVHRRHGDNDGADPKHAAAAVSVSAAAGENENQETGQRTAAASTAGTRDYGGLRNYVEAVKSLAELNEERQLLVNVGAAVLVIVALGTYIITSTIGSGEAKQ